MKRVNQVVVVAVALAIGCWVFAWAPVGSVFAGSTAAVVDEQVIKLFGPTERTLGGPGNFRGRCDAEIQTIFRSDIGEVTICTTLENTGDFGDCSIQLFDTDRPITTLRPGASFSHCKSQEALFVQCEASLTCPHCSYRWRVDRF